MNKLFKQFGVFRDEQSLSPVLSDHVFQDYPSLAELQRHYGVAGHLVPTSRALPLEFDLGRDEEQCQWAGIKVPDSGDPAAPNLFTLGVYVGGGVVTKGIWYAIEAGSLEGIGGRIELYDVANDAVVHEIVVADISLAVNDYSVFAKYIKLEEPHILRFKFDSMPSTDADGNGVFYNECEPAPCLRVKVHLLVDDTCYKPTLYPCDKGGCDGFDEPPFVCPPATGGTAPVLNPPVLVDGAASGNGGDTVNIAALDNTGGTVVTWSAAGLPLGLSIDPATGVISGTIDAGGFGGTVVVTATNADGSDTGDLVLSYTGV